MKYNPRDENSIKAVMAKANVVLNLIGLYSLHLILLVATYFGMLRYVSCFFFFFFKPFLWAGREYETRNFSFEEVNHAMAEQLAMVGSLSLVCVKDLFKILLVEFEYIFWGASNIFPRG